MNYLPFVLISYLLNSVTVTVDKFLLTKLVPDPIIYIFYFSMVSLVLSMALPFSQIPSSSVLIYASVSTILWTLGAYFMLKALKVGQVQRVIPVIGTITPLVLLILASQTQSITQKQGIAIVILILGLVFLTFKDLKGKLILKELTLEIFSALFFAFSYFFLREAFLRADFLTVLIWSRPILIPFGIMFFIIPHFRNKLAFLIHPKKTVSQNGGRLFILGQVCAGISELMLNFSISLANPAIVNSLQGVKYVYLFIFSLILGKKYPTVFQNNLSLYFYITQVLGISAIGVGLYLLAI